MFERKAPCLERRLFLGREGAHIRFGRRVRDHGLEIGKLHGGGPIALHFFHDRSQFRELAGELYIGFGRERPRQLRFQRGVADQHDVEFGFRKHGSRDGYRGMPSAAAKATSLSRIEPAGILVPDQRVDHGRRLAGIEFERHRLDGADGGGNHRQMPIAERNQGQRADGLRRHLAAQRHRLAVGMAAIGDVPQRSQHRKREIVETRAHPQVTAIRRKQELRQVIGADRQKIDPFEQFVELIQQCRHLHHGSDLDALRQPMVVAAQIHQFAFHQVAGVVEFAHDRDHRKHHLQLAPRSRAQHGADLAAQQRRAIEAEPDGTPAERGVFLLHIAHVGQHLVAADVEGAERHRTAAGRVEDGAVKRQLLTGAGKLRRHHELQFSAKQPDSGRAGFDDVGQIDQQAGIEIERNLDAVPGDARLVAQREILLLPARPQPDPLHIGRLEIGRRADVHLPGGAVHDDGIAGIDEADRIADLADRRDPQRPRHDGDMRRRPPSSSTTARRRLRS